MTENEKYFMITNRRGFIKIMVWYIFLPILITYAISLAYLTKIYGETLLTQGLFVSGIIFMFVFLLMLSKYEEHLVNLKKEGRTETELFGIIKIKLNL